MKRNFSLLLRRGLPVLLASLTCCSPAIHHVVVYTSLKPAQAGPVFAEFSKRTGVVVQAAYEAEAAKTGGLAGRLESERNHPVCDVFWNNEEYRTRLLAAEGIFDAKDGLFYLGHRSRRMVVNTNMVKPFRYPHSLDEFTNSVWKGHVALAYPMDGPTSTYFLALRQHWPEPRWLVWCANLMANKLVLVDGDADVVKVVGEGKAWIGLTDSDEIEDARKEGAPVRALPLNSVSLLLQNTLGLVAQAPHPTEARQLMEFLQSPEAGRALMNSGVVDEMDDGKDAGYTLKVDWDALMRDAEPVTAKLQGIFGKGR
jgi:iron(III) transport system substrate-binding protein